MAGLTVAVVLTGAPIAGLATPAGANPIGATKAQVSALQSQIEAGAARMHQLTMAYDQANLNATALAQQVRADRTQIAQLQQESTGSQAVLRADAILSYTGATTTGGLGAPSESADPSIRAEYLQVATGDINDAVDRYRTDQRQLTTADSNLEHQEQASRAAATAAARASQQALSLATTEQAQLDQLQSHLAGMITAASTAARLASAQTAQAAVATQAARSAGTGTQGLPVNNGLIDVVHAIVTPSVPPPPRTPPQTPPPSRVPPSTPGYTPAGGVWLQLRDCESGDNYGENTGNGFFGAYQFSGQTWADLGYPGRPDIEPAQLQDQAAMRLEAVSGWSQWPTCAAALGLH